MAEDIVNYTTDFKLAFNETGITIVSVLNEKKLVVVPEQFGEYKVTKIGKRAFGGHFSQLDKIEEVILPDTITEIGKGSFQYRQFNLKKVTLPKNIKVIPEELFDSCDSLEEIIVPDGVEEIKAGAFNCGTSLKKVIIPASVKKIHPNFLSDKEGLYKDAFLSPITLFIVEPDSYAEQFLRAYEPNYHTNTLNVIYEGEDNEQLIGTHGAFEFDLLGKSNVKVAFAERYVGEKLYTPVLLNGKRVTVLDMEKNHIKECVKQLYISKFIEKIVYPSYSMFSDNENKLEKIEVAPENKTFSTDGIGLYNYDKTVLHKIFVQDITNYQVPEGVTVIEERAFESCNQLATVTLPTTIKELGNRAFVNCAKLETITGIENVKITGENALYGTLYSQKLDIVITGTTFAMYKKLDSTTYTVPEGVEIIGESAFSRYRVEIKLEEIILPSTLKVIQRNAFYGCKHIKKIVIPEGVTTLGISCFEKCEQLEEIILPKSLETIERNAFADCIHLKTLHIPQNVSQIDISALPKSNLDYYVWESDQKEVVTAFEGVTVSEENKTFCAEQGVLYSKDKTILYYIPDNYKEETFIIPETVTKIKRGACAKNQNIKTIHFTNVIETFETSCFYMCRSLEKVIFSEEQTIISNGNNDAKSVNKQGIFGYCKKLSDVTLPSKLKEIGSSTFYNCGLKKITLPETITYIGDSAFGENKIKELILPKSVEKIGGSIASGNLQKVTLYDSIEANVKECLIPSFGSGVQKWPSNISRIGIPAFVVGSRGQDLAVWSSFEVIVLSATTDEEKYRVYMPSNKNWKEFFAYVKAWGNKASFKFEQIDKIFGTLKENKLSYAVERLRRGEKISDELKETMIKYLVRNAKDFVKNSIDANDLQAIIDCEPFGIIKKANIEELIEYAEKKKKKQIVEHLNDYKTNELKIKDKSKTEDNETQSKPTVSKTTKKTSKIAGYEIVESSVFECESAMDMQTTGIEYCQFRFRGKKEEIEKLKQFLVENKIKDFLIDALEDDVSEARVWAGDTTVVLIDEFPLLKATGLCECWGDAKVKVVYSESGYRVITECKDAGFFDSRHDSGDGRWAYEYDMMDKVKTSFTWLQTGEVEKVNYSYPYKTKWNKKDFVIEKDGELYRKKVATKKENKKEDI